MNYRHNFHAGNFADVHKHTVLTRVLVHLGEKAAPFRVIDTHAGGGRYDLASEAAERTGEWRLGIGKLIEQLQTGAVADLMAPYLSLVAAESTGALRYYPGSPLIARSFLRRDDRLIACEAEPVAMRALSKTLGRDNRCKPIEIDGWKALTAYVPPKERRGLVLIDPPYEQPDEFGRLAVTLSVAWRKWPTGIYMAWYPIKDRATANQFAREIQQTVSSTTLRSELLIAPPEAGDRLFGSGLIIINPPWRLADELLAIVPALARWLGRDGAGAATQDWLHPPT